jgi:hypothetical protein
MGRTYSEAPHSVTTACLCTLPGMSESDHTSTLDPQAPAPASAQPAPPAPAAHDPHHPPYAAPQQPRFVDRVLGMRAVIAVALAALIIGGLSGFLLGEHTGGDDRFGRGGPGGFPGGQGFRGGPQGMPGQQGQQSFGQGQTTP